MEIVSFSDGLFKQRSVLLQNSLRPNCNSYPIECEYPIVLSLKNPQFSYCVTEDDRKFSTPKLVAHANFWPRLMLEKSTQSEFPVALIGNVATDSSYRGMGIMRNLFADLWDNALSKGYDALILWSDLENFYRKLGFNPCGREYRFCFSSQRLKSYVNSCDFFVPSLESLNQQLLDKMLHLRPETPASLKRSSEEFAQLLGIPDTVVLVSYEQDEIQSYFVLGKGNDMIGVVHEWGAKSPELVLDAMQYIVKFTNWDMIWLLSPVCLAKNWISVFRPYVKKLETHPVALAKIKKGSPIGRVIQESFIWGLDSI